MLLWLYGCALPLAAAWVVAPRARLPPPAPRGAAAARAARSSPRMAVWSDMKAVMEYQDRLEGKFQVDVPDQASVILGDAPLAQVLAGFGLGDDVRIANVADGAWTLPDAVVNARDERLLSGRAFFGTGELPPPPKHYFAPAVAPGSDEKPKKFRHGVGGL